LYFIIDNKNTKRFKGRINLKLPKKILFNKKVENLAESICL